MSTDNNYVRVEFERYAELVDCDNCLLLNPTVRDTMRVLLFLGHTGCYPVHADDVALFTSLAPEFVSECLATLALEGFIRETDLGFQTYLEVERMTWRSHRGLDQALRDIQDEPAQVRSRSGAWDGGYLWPEAPQFP